MQLERDEMVGDHDASGNALSRKCKQHILSDHSTKLKEHNMRLPQQGELMHCASDPAAAIWAKAVARLSSGSMKL